ncbi:hypothetical protein SAMN05444411_103238 [Lutibacter oricola]|uniref:GLPGLI family protein n=1 Tax=Lutibacter oricola TaxID=762486 RepID=A0A1H2ZFS1_9FLAO|nr:hypothetical protein [Lutibacter oricola]SDX16241.1 hypothetical protein SAMN05444411_103238 [Lutibacter oricola]
MKKTLLIITLFIGLANVNAQKMVGYITVNNGFLGKEGVFMTTVRYCNFSEDYMTRKQEQTQALISFNKFLKEKYGVTDPRTREILWSELKLEKYTKPGWDTAKEYTELSRKVTIISSEEFKFDLEE